MFADLSGVPIVRARLIVPLTGLWHADVTLDRADGPALLVPQVLTLAGSTWACTPIRAIDFSGQRQLRLVGGAGGWRKVVPFQEYQSPIGVPAQMVLTDAASLVGELTPVVAPTIPVTVGPYFCRQRGRAGLVLNQVLGASWWLDPLGVVQSVPRVPAPVASPFDAIEVDGVLGRYEVATDFPGDWAPGKLFAGPTISGTINRVCHLLEAGTFRTEILAA